MTDPIKAEPVAWKVQAPDSHYCELRHTSLGEPLGGLLIENGWTETPLYAADQLEALQQRVRELEEALQPFVRSCAWVEADDYPIRISNDHTVSGFDLLPEEVERARKALGQHP